MPSPDRRKSATTLKLPAEYIEALKQSETGTGQPALEAVKSPEERPKAPGKGYEIGYGITRLPAPKVPYKDSRVYPGMTMSEPEVERTFKRVLKDHETPVKESLGDTKLTPEQYSALVDYNYNSGLFSEARSPRLFKALREQSPAAVATELVLLKGQGKEFAGLAERSAVRAAAFDPDYSQWVGLDYSTNPSNKDAYSNWVAFKKFHDKKVANAK